MSWLSSLFSRARPEDLIASYIGAGMLQAGIEAQLDAMDAGDKALFAAPAQLLVKGVIKRGSFIYDVTGYQLRKRAK